MSSSPALCPLLVLLALLVGAGPAAARETPPPAIDLAPYLEVAEQRRGLAIDDVPVAHTRTREAFRATAKKDLEKQLPPAELEATERVMELLGLIPEDWPLARRLLDLQAAEVSGYYDPDTGEMVLIEDDGTGDADWRKLEERLVWVHEATHLLQDRAFDLERLEGRPFLDDAAFARGALVEGDATHVMLSDLVGFGLERMPPWMKRELDLDQLGAAEIGTPSSPELAAAPRYVASSLLMPYLKGAEFVAAIREKGGAKLLDHAFHNDFPRSSEQILHPEKWLSERDEPVVVRLPAVGGPFAGTPGFEGSLGELGIRAFLPENAAPAAAAGWGGDRFGYWRSGRTELLLWLTEWDRGADAAEFRAALEPRGFTVEAAGTRVVLLWQRGLPKALPGELLRSALAVPAERQAGTAPDLTKLGISPPAVPRATFVDLLESFAGRPQIAALFGQSAGEETPPMELLAQATEFFRSHPELVARLEEILSRPDHGGLLEVMSSPEVSALRSQIVEQETRYLSASLSPDGRFRIETVCQGSGLAGWQRTALPPGSQASLVMTHAGLEAKLVVVSLAMPLAAPNPEFLKGFTTSLREEASAVVSERTEPGEKVARQYLEMLGRDGELRSCLVVVTDGHVSLLMASFSPQRRREVRPAIEKIFSSVRCGAETAKP